MRQCEVPVPHELAPIFADGLRQLTLIQQNVAEIVVNQKLLWSERRRPLQKVARLVETGLPHANNREIRVNRGEGGALSDRSSENTLSFRYIIGSQVQ